MEESILKVRDLTVELSIQGKNYAVVDNMNFDLIRGKTLALVGESGCGKSLTALSLMRILPTPPALPSKGEILYKGENLTQVSEKRMRSIRGGKMAMIFQDPLSSLNPVYSIGDQLLEVVEIHLSLKGEQAYLKIIESLKQVGIPNPEERIFDYPHQLSGGMRQRVMIAMALLCKPDILIADEPTTALDVTIQAQVLELIRKLQKEEGMALLLITHDMGIVAELADSVVVMYASQKIEEGTSFDIFDHMAHPYTQGLFKSRPSLSTSRDTRLPAIKGSVPPITHYPTGCRFHPRCPFKMPKCVSHAPPSFKAPGGPLHHARCWLLDGTEESQKKLEGGNHV
ncbi:ABC transporter ATP-binding protein [Criblamydia sequanensis]|uniref:Oligopeptide/dipeptide ABC transporter, ATPase subunit n=1 Tax=Candidatus Criblamydia sequanensis CRIB-18 TaxID=1437425 RepID=A0A090D2F9_9BACT|nr:ABC transporter ATP-binding protein [Criblamydia sequanensis]CDR34620.1 Oligopeptide/dipeptide ABC transporter, ATPase subunit [Criblamydia sequanensis CRIB-18]